MCFWKKSLAVAGAAVMMLVSSVMSQVQVTPYGAAQYRLRFQLNSLTNEFADPDDPNKTKEESFGTFDYSNRLCYRLGLRAKVDDQFSMQFQIGNDWGAAENVNYQANNTPGYRVGTPNLYVHLASFRWNPGAFFMEAGVVPLNSNGTLDLLERSLRSSHNTPGAVARYGGAIFNGWGDNNNSMIGLKLGMPIIKEGVKVSAELFQTVLDARTQSLSASTTSDPKQNPSSIMMVLTVPIEAGDFKITPEITGIMNRNYNSDKEKGDNESLFGLAGSYKVNDDVSLTFRGGFSMLDNGNTVKKDSALVKDQGMLFGLGTSVKAGPGVIQFAVDYNSTENTEVKNGESLHQYIYTDLRYVYKVHPRVTVTPRYRTYSTMFPEKSTASNFRMDNRFEAIIEGSF